MRSGSRNAFHRWTVGGSLIVLLMAGCVAGRESWVKSELYFGVSRPTVPETENAGHGSEVLVEISPEEWARFMDQEVTPRFPDGLTVLDGIGQYRDGQGRLIREKCKVLVILRPGSPGSSRLLDDIRRAYVEQFGQESVLRVDHPVKARFD